MKKFLTIAAIAFALTGCATAPMPVLTADEQEFRINSCKYEIQKVAKDPDSAIFRDAEIGKHALFGNTIRVFVNAKNSFGGYTGFKAAFCSVEPVRFITVVN